MLLEAYLKNLEVLIVEKQRVQAIIRCVIDSKATDC